jgi:hypothetical protein
MIKNRIKKLQVIVHVVVELHIRSLESEPPECVEADVIQCSVQPQIQNLYYRANHLMVPAEFRNVLMT